MKLRSAAIREREGLWRREGKGREGVRPVQRPWPRGRKGASATSMVRARRGARREEEVQPWLYVVAPAKTTGGGHREANQRWRLRNEETRAAVPAWRRATVHGGARDDKAYVQVECLEQGKIAG